MSRDTIYKTILSAKAATGTGTAMNVEDFRHAVLALVGAGTSVLTVKIQGSIQKERPDFSAAQSATNQWDYVQIIDLEDASAIDGDSGVALAADEAGRQFEVNTNGLVWLCATVTAYTSGNVTILATAFGNK